VSWRVARLEEIPPDPLHGDPEWWRDWTDRTDIALRWHSVRQHFGISAFGVNAVAGDDGDQLVVRHAERDYGGGEELYLVIRGRARFRCDGEEVELGPGELLYVAPEVEREGDAAAPGTLLLAVGATPGKPYRHWADA
jgi:mannose-6-phosphate isomerase-like protein (cupin superfamily)